MVGVPVLVAATIWAHPPDPSVPADLAGSTDLYIWLHVALLALIPLLGIVVWMLLDGVAGPSASAARFLLAPAVAFYAAFDALVGIGSGVLAREALAMGPDLTEGAGALASRWMEIPVPLSLVAGIGTSLWVVTVTLAGFAHVRAGSRSVIGWGLIISAPLFGWGHPRLTGVLAMAALLAAVVGAESVRRRAAASTS